MTAFVLHGIAAGLVIVLACGDSPKDSATGTARPPARPAAQADLCALLTEAEAEAILGRPLAAPERQPGGDCWYPEQAGSGGGEIMLHVLPVRFESKETFHAFLVKETKAADASLKKAMQGTGATIKETVVEPVQEVEGPAYYAEPSLFVLKGGQVLAIFADRPQAVQVAAKALPRF
jgi:hypothetical protein